MSGDAGEAPRWAPANLEIPIEPLPTEPLVPRPPLPEVEPPLVERAPEVAFSEPAPEAELAAEPEPTQPMAWVDLDAADDVVPHAEPDPAPVPAPAAAAEPASQPRPERETAGPGVLRPTTPRPAVAGGAQGAPRFDKRHPIRAGLGLLTLALLSALALAVAIGLAIALIAFAFRKTVG